MNICIFSDTYIPEVNGVATSVSSLFQSLKKRGQNVYLVTTGDEKTAGYKDHILRIKGLELKKLYGYRMTPLFNQDAFKIIEDLKIDVIHINTPFSIGQFGFTVASKLGIPVVYTYHTMLEDYTYYATKGYFDRFSKWTIREFSRSDMERSTEIIAPSDKTMNYLRSINIKKYINVVPTGFDFSRFKNVKDNDQHVLDIKKKYDIGEDKKVLLCLGRVAKEKSFDVILRGYATYLDKYPENDSIILFVGDGPQLESLKELANKLKIDKRIRFTGKVNVNETQYYYHCSNLFLSASISETQGLTFMEAMASYVPIFCRFDNNLVGIIENNSTGFFFMEDNEFAEKLHYILSLDKDKMTEIENQAFKSIDKFSEKNFYDNIINVYERAIRRNW
ncbi:MAG: glycosyltransferase [Bacilli bacterium]